MALKVFLAEDSRHVQEVIWDLLRSAGDFERVGQVSTEAEAIYWLQSNTGRWDLAVIDLVLEQGTGMGTIAHCSPRPAGAKVVVFSDYASEGIRRHCMDLGADAVFSKGDPRAFADWCSALPGAQAEARRA